MRNKKYRNIKSIVAVIIVAVVLVSFIGFSSSANDYNSWDSDFGDFGGGSSGSSDYGGFDYGGSDSDDDRGWFSFWFFDGSDGDSPNTGTGISDIIGGFIIVLIIIGIVALITVLSNNANAKTTPIINMGDSSSVDEESLAELRQKDPEFSEAAILSWSENLFTTMQLAWSDFEYEQVRPFLGNALFAEHEKQLKAKSERNEKNCRSEIAVLQKKLERYKDDGHNEYLDVWLRIKMRDTLVKKSDPSVVIHPAKTFYMDFRWQLVRTSGAKTVAETDGVKTGTCPNCGAPINMNQSGKCEYCDSVISTEEHNWVLNKIDALQQRSV